VNCESLLAQAFQLQRRGHAEQAEGALREALSTSADPVFHLALGALLHDLGRLDEAMGHYAQALDGDNRLAAAAKSGLRDLGVQQTVAALERGDFPAAEKRARQLLVLLPEDRVLRHDLALAFHHGGQTEAARRALEGILESDPTDVNAHVNLGAVLQDLGDVRLASAHFQVALQHDPNCGPATRNLAALRRRSGDLDQAGVYLEYARRNRAANAELLAGLTLQRALQLPAIYQSTAEIDYCRERLLAVLDALDAEDFAFQDPLRSIGATAFFLAYHGHGDVAIQRQIASLVARGYTPQPVEPGPARSDGRVRVGLVSTYFKNHTIGKLNLGTVRNIDRERFSVHVFSIGDHQDRTATAFRRCADHYEAVPRSLDAARAAIARANLDVLLFTDIGMEPVTYFLAFSRLAPVQCVTWGHPITTGIDTVDYFISAVDAECDGNERHYSERLVALRTMQPHYARPQIAGGRKPRAALGVPDDRTLYLCPQSLFKFHPDFDVILREILRGDPRGILVLVEGQNRTWSELLKARFRNTLPDVAHRILFLPRMSGADFMSLIACADVVLDTPVFCGGNTTYEALGLGKPVVTLPSDLLRGRLTYAVYRKMGYLDCVADDPARYVDIALRLGTDLDFRRTAEAAVQERAASLFEDLRAVRELEGLFARAVAGERGIPDTSV